MDRVVRLITHGQAVATFYAEPDPPLAFWRVELPGRAPWHSPARVTGDESPDFFRALLAVARGAH